MNHAVQGAKDVPGDLDIGDCAIGHQAEARQIFMRTTATLFQVKRGIETAEVVPLLSDRYFRTWGWIWSEDFDYWFLQDKRRDWSGLSIDLNKIRPL
jgi:hypothetical protein